MVLRQFYMAFLGAAFVATKAFSMELHGNLRVHLFYFPTTAQG